MKNELIKPAGLVKKANRRQFLKRGTLSVATAGLLLVGCNDDEMMPMDGGVSLGSGDFGILNYAYALEQLEAAFHAAVLAQLENRIRQHYVIQQFTLIIFTIGSQLLTSSHRVCP